ncbi:MAG: hypothetical protein J0H68_09910, partial [Sphingobacteriia bacterium]|nr:hypothetical protein [Sphingobacteriia bacterium]
GSISEYQKNLKNVEKEISSKDLKTQLKNILFIREMLPHVLDEKKLATIDIFKYKNLRKLEGFELQKLKTKQEVSKEEEIYLNLLEKIKLVNEMEALNKDISANTNEITQINKQVAELDDNIESNLERINDQLKELKLNLPDLYDSIPEIIESISSGIINDETINKLKSGFKNTYKKSLLKRVFQKTEIQKKERLFSYKLEKIDKSNKIIVSCRENIRQLNTKKNEISLLLDKGKSNTNTTILNREKLIIEITKSVKNEALKNELLNKLKVEKPVKKDVNLSQEQNISPKGPRFTI